MCYVVHCLLKDVQREWRKFNKQKNNNSFVKFRTEMMENDLNEHNEK